MLPWQVASQDHKILRPLTRAMCPNHQIPCDEKWQAKIIKCYPCHVVAWLFLHRRCSSTAPFFSAPFFFDCPFFAPSVIWLFHHNTFLHATVPFLRFPFLEGSFMPLSLTVPWPVLSWLLLYCSFPCLALPLRLLFFLGSSFMVAFFSWLFLNFSFLYPAVPFLFLFCSFLTFLFLLCSA